VKPVKLYFNDKKLVTLEADLFRGSILYGVLIGYEYNISQRYFIKVYIDLVFVYLTMLSVAQAVQCSLSYVIF
jgi:hypothetical protein